MQITDIVTRIAPGSDLIPRNLRFSRDARKWPAQSAGQFVREQPPRGTIEGLQGTLLAYDLCKTIRLNEF